MGMGEGRRGGRGTERLDEEWGVERVGGATAREDLSTQNQLQTNFKPTLKQLLVDNGMTCQLKTNCKPTSNKPTLTRRTDFVSTQNQLQTNFKPTLNQLLIDNGKTCQLKTNFKPTLNQLQTNFEPTIG